MHKYPQNQSYQASSAQTLTKNVSMTLCSWPICHQTRVLCGCTTFGTESNQVPNHYGPYAHYSLDTTVAKTKGGGIILPSPGKDWGDPDGGWAWQCWGHPPTTQCPKPSHPLPPSVGFGQGRPVPCVGSGKIPVGHEGFGEHGNQTLEQMLFSQALTFANQIKGS